MSNIGRVLGNHSNLPLSVFLRIHYKITPTIPYAYSNISPSPKSSTHPKPDKMLLRFYLKPKIFTPYLIRMRPTTGKSSDDDTANIDIYLTP